MSIEKTQQVHQLLNQIHQNPTTIFPSVSTPIQQKIRDALKFILQYYGINGIIIDNFTDEQIYYQINEFNKQNLAKIKGIQKKIEKKIDAIKPVEIEEDNEKEKSGDSEKEDLSYMDEEIDMDKMNQAIDEMDNFELGDGDLDEIVDKEEDNSGEDEMSEENNDSIEDHQPIEGFEQDDDNDEVQKEPKNEFEKQQEIIKNKITKLEEENMKEKHWSMLGEIKGEERPVDSLVDLDIDFQNTNRPPPPMTKEQTLSLEDLIRRRIKEQSWDDVVRKTLVQKKEKKEIELDGEKSKLGLGEIYEQKYAKEIYGFNSKDEELNQQKKEIMKTFEYVMKELDKLTSAYR
ncbi:U3 small nucleolar ribonucleoprotein subunit [Entamoeba histolytica HM-3:IMSS]|uniref:U3 small nucleolar ribonucleoprotein subunit n=1 Tax=Entamoeba histolytica HM-3:IMSS TaxID=885315 RepID=M7W619_ENTHI|nr:U3 small nucleolar ribonucleoprotein subunit [Entamoeba histolytica HM-3:IMSS]